jgi:magnesium-transporting ATPase (P-type)
MGAVQPFKADGDQASSRLQPVGLTSSEVQRRRLAGQTNTIELKTSRSVSDIVRANVLTRFNAIIVALLVVVLVYGDPIDAMFGFVMVFNSLIGIVQEVRAKRSLDALRVLVVPEIGVYRDGRRRTVAPADLVLGDVLHLESGDQIPVDGPVLDSQGLEVDESALTGESIPVDKPAGSEVLSGSFVVAGSAVIEAGKVGADSWVNQLTREAKGFVLTHSELRTGIHRLLGVVAWLLPPLTAMLLWSQLRSESNLADGMVSAVAGVVSLVPQGLVLLISMAMAVAVIRLSRNKVVTQELAAVEGLARVDTLCVDKTGTLTTGRLTVDHVEVVDDAWSEAGVIEGLSALVELEAARSATTEAITAAVGPGPGWTVSEVVAFSSVRKWSAARFDGHGVWILGAPEILLDATPIRPATDAAADRIRHRVRHRVDELTGRAQRVLLMAWAEGELTDELGREALPADITPIGFIALKEEVRPDAAATMEYFRRQNVEIRVISGDNPRTVTAVATEIGIPGADRYIDMRTVTSIADIPPDTVVFGRVLPEQKRDLVRFLQEQGHTVAMTGDGVNDIPSLKASDIGIAMNTATPATKATAQLVLLDGRFDRLPVVVAEGRRVIANMERVSSLFITKTVYASLLIVTVSLAVIPFPFLPRHLSLIAAVTIGIPAFVLSFRASNEPCRPGYLRRVLRFSIPAGIVAATATLAAYWGVRSPLSDADLDQARTAATITLTLTGLWIVYRLVRPVDAVSGGLLLVLAAGFGALLMPSPLSEFYALPLPPVRVLAVIVGVLMLIIAALEVLLSVMDRYSLVDRLLGESAPRNHLGRRTRPGAGAAGN